MSTAEVLGVSRSGFLAWLGRPISDRAAHDAKLVIAIDKSFRASDRTYGARRVWRDVPEGVWRWPNFSPAEIACRGTGKLLINEAALDKLLSLRDRLA